MLDIWAIPHLFERLFVICWGNNMDCKITMPLSLKTVEVQIKGDQIFVTPWLILVVCLVVFFFFFFLEYAVLQELLKRIVYANFGDKQSFIGNQK